MKKGPPGPPPSIKNHNYLLKGPPKGPHYIKKVILSY